MKLVYPAVFYPEESGGYTVIIPDLNDLATQGDSLEEAVFMARDACGLYIRTALKNCEEIPKASDSYSVKPDEKNAFVKSIDINILN